MKILHIVYSITGGAGIAALNLHNTLNQIDGIESFIIEKSDPSILDPNITTIYESKNILYRLKRKLGLTPEVRNQKQIPMFPRHNEYEIATFPTSSFRLEDLDIVKQADIIHLHWISNFVNYPTFFEKIKKPIVWTLHDRNPFSGVFHFQTDVNNNPKYKNLENKISAEKRNYIAKNNNKTLVFPSQWLLNNSNLEKFEPDTRKICIPYMVPFPDEEVNKHSFNLDKSKKTILFIAHSIETKRKGFHLLEEAMQSIDSSKFNLITIGENNSKTKYTNHLHFDKITDRSLIYYLYLQSDVVVLSSLEDNLPNVMLESFACGTPVISFANGGMAEHITTGENGILIDKISSDSLKNAILDFLNDKYVFDRDKIIQYAKNHFLANIIANKYKELYTNLLKS